MDEKFGFSGKIVVYHVVQHWDINSTGLVTNTCECSSAFYIESGSMVKASSEFDPLGVQKERVLHSMVKASGEFDSLGVQKERVLHGMVKASSEFDPLGVQKERVLHTTWLKCCKLMSYLIMHTIKRYKATTVNLIVNDQYEFSPFYLKNNKF